MAYPTLLFVTKFQDVPKLLQNQDFAIPLLFPIRYAKHINILQTDTYRCNKIPIKSWTKQMSPTVKLTNIVEM